MSSRADLAKGGPISSGVVASACKTVVDLRRKGGGRRWGEDGADAVAHLRARFRSEKGQGEGFCSQNGRPSLPSYETLTRQSSCASETTGRQTASAAMASGVATSGSSSRTCSA